ncbi:MAG: GNAT family N-acetyltransferase [Gemmatimonadota bacterium]
MGSEEVSRSCLEVPSERCEASFLEGAAEFAAEGRLDSTYAGFLGYDLARLQREFPTFVWDLCRLGQRQRLRSTGYQDRVLWLVDGGQYIGQTSIRPELNTPYLITYGGHIGYSIRPSRRRRGYGRRILALALEKAAAMGMERALVTCDADNQASRRIIEANGGRFESAMAMTRDVLRAEGRTSAEAMDKLRYWIELAGGSRGTAP